MPEWVSAIGVSVTKLSLENFVLPVDDYEAYDKEKLPFVVDIRAFFHIKDCMMAATRASSMDLLRKQLADVVKDAVRTILAQDDLEKIMVERSKYGDEFIKEVNQHLASWGVETIKTIELMDIRDSRGEEVISNIMAKKKSAIEKDSRVTVAKNQQEAKEAEIARDAKVVEAEADRRKTEIDAEAAKRAAELEAALVRATKNAEGIEAEGKAKAGAEEAMQLASVTAQTSLAKEIGENDGYQQYLIEIRKVEATEKVGLEQARNINGSNIKIIANAGNVAEGLNSALDVLTPKGGSNIAGALEAFAATDAGKALLEKLGVKLG